MSNENKNQFGNDLDSNVFIKAYSMKNLVFSTDFLMAFLCTTFIMSLVAYFSMHFQSAHKSQTFLVDISNMICSNAINIDSSLLGIIIAAVAIYASFSRFELLAKLYEHKKDEKRLHQYVLVLFFPAIPAIIGIFFAFTGNVLIIAENNFAILFAWISLFFTFYCIFGVWESVKQIAKSIITQAKNKKT